MLSAALFSISSLSFLVLLSFCRFTSWLCICVMNIALAVVVDVGSAVIKVYLKMQNESSSGTASAQLGASAKQLELEQ